MLGLLIISSHFWGKHFLSTLSRGLGVYTGWLEESHDSSHICVQVLVRCTFSACHSFSLRQFPHWISGAPGLCSGFFSSRSLFRGLLLPCSPQTLSPQLRGFSILLPSFLLTVLWHENSLKALNQKNCGTNFVSCVSGMANLHRLISIVLKVTFHIF